ncbi:hypothetical protein Tco_1149108 [Tanacetum coccineum]
MSMGRVCIATKIQSLIHENVEVNILGKTFQVFVKEIGTWNIHISNDIESNDSLDEDISSNGNVDLIEALDDFIKHVVEEKQVEKTPLRTPKLMTLNLLVNYTVTHKDMAADEVVLDNSKPPGFENFIKENKACSWSSSTSRASKCSTSFANYSRKDLKGFSFIDEMNQMIEVGGDLGYDVKGCKKYLMKRFEDMVKEKWAAISDLEQSKPLHTKLKDLKSHLKLWIQELEDLEKLESMDLVQKSSVKWEVEGDENLKFFHGLINFIRKSQMVQGIMLDGDSPISFPRMLSANRLSIADQDFLESMVSMDEIKAAVWDSGSQKASGPNGYYLMFIKKF